MKLACLIFLLVIVLFLCGEANRSNAQGAAQTRNTDLQLSTRVLEQRYCNDPNAEDQFDVKMQLELQYKNVGKRTVIFDRDSDTILGYRSAGAIKDLEVAPYNERSNARQRTSISETGDKPSSRFVTLKPNQTYLVETNFRLPYSSEWALKENQILQIVVSTWSGTKKQSDELKEKWKSIGLLWTDDVRSQPMQFSIEQDPQLEECSSASN